MAKKAAADYRQSILKSLAKMLVTHIQENCFDGMNTADLSHRLGVTETILNAPWWHDVASICEGAGLDVGLTVRDPKGHEVTFWPAENLSEGYKRPKDAPKEEKPVEPKKIKGTKKAKGGYSNLGRVNFFDYYDTDIDETAAKSDAACVRKIKAVQDQIDAEQDEWEASVEAARQRFLKSREG